MPRVERFFDPSNMAGRISTHAPHVIAADDKEGQADCVALEYEQESYFPEVTLI
jgi:hypothetical protein